jgi:Dynamin family/Dynamin central region
MKELLGIEMEDQSEAETPIISLQSKGHGDLLNIIDSLRSQGISRYIDLPQLIVCGDQSSGKSSVLEAVSGIRFPTKDNLCTRFATELILRRGPDINASVAIVPSSDRTDSQKAKLLKFRHDIVELDQFEDLVSDAKDAMGLDGDEKAFSNDILRVEVSGPNQPHLTLVDLPGLFQAGNKAQSDTDAQVVKDLVLSYMKKSRSIILAVVSAKNDFANQIVTKYARQLDPHGWRTLGIITKPDTLHVGSDSERSFVDLAENKDVNFRLGWHVLKNRDYDTRDCSAEERDLAEKEFFSRGIWTTLPPTHVGITSLKPRLSTLLKDQILMELPSLIRDVELGLKECQSILERLGGARATLKDQRLHLLQISQAFSSLAKAAVGGIYVDQFFGSAMTPEGYNKRLRAVAKTILTDFANVIRTKGHAKCIKEDDAEVPANASPRCIKRSDYIQEVMQQMKRSSGCELPGTYNPLIIGDLFFEQAAPWEMHVKAFMARLIEASRTTVNLILEHIADEETIIGLMRQIINPKMDALKQATEQKADEVLGPHQRGHPKTYNHYFIENVQKAKERHWKRFLEERLCSHFGLASIEETYHSPKNGVQLQPLVTSMTSRTEADMDRFACSEATDCMLAYYKVRCPYLISIHFLCIRWNSNLCPPGCAKDACRHLQRACHRAVSAATVAGDVHTRGGFCARTGRD